MPLLQGLKIMIKLHSSIFSDDSTDSNEVVNRKIKVEQVLRLNTWDLESAHLRIDGNRDELLREAAFMASRDTPKLNKANAEKFFNCDDFSIFFAALCAVYFQLYLTVLRGTTNINDKLVSVKAKLLECLKELSRKYKKIYTDKEIDSYIMMYGKDSWHKKKAESLKFFAKKFESSDEDFPYILFTYMHRFFFYQKTPIIPEELRRISLYCAYYSNKNYIHENINKFILDRFIKFENQKFGVSENLKLSMKKRVVHWLETNQTGFKSILNLDDVLFLLRMDCTINRIKSRRIVVPDPVKQWEESYSLRYHFAEFEESIAGLITRCTGKKWTRFRNETEPQEHVIQHLKTILRAPQDVFKRFPAVALLAFWATSCIKYNEFKALFLKREKPEVYYVDGDPERYLIKESERHKPIGNNFMPIPPKGEKDNEASKLQYMLFFALCALSPAVSNSFFENKLLPYFKNALFDSSWHDTKKQLELLNILLVASHLPTVTNTVDFLDFDGKGFSQTESAVNLIYNISNFALVSTELGIVQQVNHLDELRNRLFKYHKPALTKPANNPKTKETFRNEFGLIKDIDCGFDINDMKSTLSYNENYCSRDMKCKVFLETDTSCIHASENPYRRLYRYSLSTIYIKQVRNMFVHYAPFSSTQSLLDIRNFNNLLEILYDIKDRLENESVLFTVSELYKDFAFSYQDGISFPKEQTESTLSTMLEELFSIIIRSELDYIQNVSTKSANEVFLFWPINGNKIWNAQDPILKPFHELQKEVEQETSNDKDEERIAAKVKERIPECFSIIRANYKAFIEFIIIKWKDNDFKTIIESLENIDSSFFHVYGYSRLSDVWTEKDTRFQSKWKHYLQSWQTYFKWKLARKDLKAAKESLKKLDYFEEGFTKLIDFKELDVFLSYGNTKMLEKEIQEIAKQLPSFILFKGIYSKREGFGRYENGRIDGDDNGSWDYRCLQSEIAYHSHEKNIELLKESLEYVEYKVLRNEKYYPTTPQYKKDFIEWLTKLEFENGLDNLEILSLADKIRTEAKSKLDDINKPFDSQSVDLFKDDPTYEPDIGLLSIVKDLLLHVICHVTSIKSIRDELNEQPILDRNGFVSFDEDQLKDIKKKLSNNDENAYPSQLHEELKQFLNFVFGISGHYESSIDDRPCEKTLLDLYGERFFLYVLRVTFEMSHMKKVSD